jgi:putative acetyltransferase
MKETVEIIDYTPQYQEDFKRLNVEWISTYFKLEAHELEMLNNPEKDILSKGGKIFFAKKGETIIGTCALKKVTETTYELVKMGVSPPYQGLGTGKKLGLKAIEAAKELGCTYLFLESNQILIPALRVYKSIGFVEIPMGETPYARADFKAEMYL